MAFGGILKQTCVGLSSTVPNLAPKQGKKWIKNGLPCAIFSSLKDEF